jgi:5'-nucleotidase
VHILITNDDGIHAKGLRTLAEHCIKAGFEVTIIAPASEKSASSHSLTLRRAIKVDYLAPGEYSVDGTPVDCMVIAANYIIKRPVDLVISGINAGQNMGEDIHYSGTVAAAKEAAFFHYKSIAISINTYRDQLFESAAQWMVKLIQNGIVDTIQQNELLNINVPNLPLQDIKGVRLTRTGHRKYYNFIKVLAETEQGFEYQIGGDSPVWENLKGTDAEAVEEGYVSITPLGFDMTKGEAFPLLHEWLEENSAQWRH